MLPGFGQVTVSFNFNTGRLTLRGEVCVPVVGSCESFDAVLTSGEAVA